MGHKNRGNSKFWSHKNFFPPGEWGGIFGILKKFLKIFLFKKVCYFRVWRLFFGVWGGFGEFDVFLGLGFDVGVCVLLEVVF